MHRLSTTFVLGYHGCSADAAEALLSGKPFKPSDNDFDWLGPGICFWEANPQRALQFADDKRKRERKAWKPAIIGAAIDLGFCLDLTTETGIAEVVWAHAALTATYTEGEEELPINRGGSDRLLRHLDCAVIRILHDLRQAMSLEPLDTVRGVFVEGGPIYENSGFYSKTHVQICVCNASRIRGVFRVPPADLEIP